MGFGRNVMSILWAIVGARQTRVLFLKYHVGSWAEAFWETWLEMKDQERSGELIVCNRRINWSKASVLYNPEVASTVDFHYQTEVLHVFAVGPAVGPRCCPVIDICGEESLFVMVFQGFPKEVVAKCVGLHINDLKGERKAAVF